MLQALPLGVVRLAQGASILGDQGVSIDGLLQRETQLQVLLALGDLRLVGLLLESRIRVFLFFKAGTRLVSEDRLSLLLLLLVLLLLLLLLLFLFLFELLCHALEKVGDYGVDFLGELLQCAQTLVLLGSLDQVEWRFLLDRLALAK